jgi:hypothetical protein
MKVVTTLLAGLCVSVLAVPVSRAVPMRPMPTVNVTGTVVEVRWFPEQTKKGLPGASGSLGHDRKFPAHFEVRLKDVDIEVVRPTDNGGLDGPAGKQAEYRLRINSDDKHLLKPGMRIKVPSYQTRGDEGGIWTKHGKIEIIAKPKPTTRE